MEQWASSGRSVSRLLTIYRSVPVGMSVDAEAKQLERQLKELGSAIASGCCVGGTIHWMVEASVGKGKWAFGSGCVSSIVVRRDHCSKGCFIRSSSAAEARSDFASVCGSGGRRNEVAGREGCRGLGRVWLTPTGENDEDGFRRCGLNGTDGANAKSDRVTPGERPPTTTKEMCLSGSFAMEELKRSPAEVTRWRLKALVGGYQGWVERKFGGVGDDDLVGV